MEWVFLFEFTPAVFILKLLNLDSHFGFSFREFSTDEASKHVSEQLVIPKKKTPCSQCFF